MARMLAMPGVRQLGMEVALDVTALVARAMIFARG